jgi:hypothetical protein
MPERARCCQTEKALAKRRNILCFEGIRLSPEMTGTSFDGPGNVLKEFFFDRSGHARGRKPIAAAMTAADQARLYAHANHLLKELAEQVPLYPFPDSEASIY